MQGRAVVQLLGICRFSYPSSVGGFQKSAQSPEAIRADLYDATRLTRRLFLFEHLTLPSIRNQTDPDFTFLLLMGETLPEPWRGRLLKLVAQVPQVVPIFHPEGQVHREAVREVMLEHRKLRGDAVGEFRLDDDDAVATDFIAASKAQFQGAKAIFAEGGKLCLDFCSGYVLAFLPDGLKIVPRNIRMWTPGQVIFRNPRNPLSILDANHLDLWQRMPTLSQQNARMFIRGAHGDNDSSLGHRAKLLDASEAMPGPLDSEVTARFALDIPALAEGWRNL